jgi:hypothetical protein
MIAVNDAAVNAASDGGFNPRLTMRTSAPDRTRNDHRRSLATLALLALACGLAAACSSEDGPGTSTGTGGGAGDAASDVEPDDGADAGADGDAESGGTLGATCTQDADCVAGLTCWRDEGDGAQFPAHGLCTVTCTDDETKCDKIVPGASCQFSGSTVKRCFEPCTFGSPEFTSAFSGMPASKCHGRNDMACVDPGDGAEPFCGFRCNDDSACGGTAKCSSFSGLCRTGAVEGWQDIGKDAQLGCSSKLVTNTTPKACTALCTVGVVPACTWTGPGTVAKAACLLGHAGAAQGDSGMCVLLCDCDADCPVLKCSPLSADLAAVTGHKGMCSSGATGISCADAGSDAGDAGDAALADASDAAGE